MEIWHLRFSSDGRHPLFRSELERRQAVLVLCHAAGAWLVTFGIVDDHLHVVVVCSRQRAGRISRALVLGLRPIARLAFEPSFVKPVESRKHLMRLMDYTIEQPARHGLTVHPVLWSGSAFSDIVGARAISGLRLRIHDVLPRYRSADAWGAAGLSPTGVPSLSAEGIRQAGLPSIVEAASHAACAPPRPRGRTPREVTARAAVVALAHTAGYRKADIASTLAITTEGVRKLGHRRPDEGVLRATRLRLAIARAIGTPSSPPPEVGLRRP